MAEKYKDPVCEMNVDPGDAYGSTQYDGRQYYFCSRECQETFEKNPRVYAHDEETEATL
jgi:YHS domain-containing protein